MFLSITFRSLNRQEKILRNALARKPYSTRFSVFRTLLLHDSHNELELIWTWLLSCPRRSQAFCFKFKMSASAAATSSRSALVFFLTEEKFQTLKWILVLTKYKHSFWRVPCCLLMTVRTPALFAYSSAPTPMRSSNFSPSATDLLNFPPVECSNYYHWTRIAEVTLESIPKEL